MKFTESTPRSNKLEALTPLDALGIEAIALSRQMEIELEKLHRIGNALIYADERGQGLPWDEAIKELYIALGYNETTTESKQ